MHNDHNAPEHNTRNFIWLMIGLVLVAAVSIACCGAGAWLAIDRIGDIPGLGDFTDAELPPVVQETPAEKQAWLEAAFADPPVDRGGDRHSLEVFFERLVEASQAEDDTEFQRLVDGDRFWTAVKERGLIKQLTRGDDRSTAALYLAELESPGAFQRYALQAVLPGKTPREATAYVIFWEDGWISEWRWWLVRDGRVWKTYDWEPLQTGVRQSLRHAAYAAEVPNLSGYEAFWTLLQKSSELQQQEKPFEATQTLHEAARLKVPAVLEADRQVDLAFAFARADRELHEIAIYKAADDKALSSAPGLLLGWAMEAYESDDFDQAIALIERYKHEVGGGPNVERVLADSLAGSGRNAEAAGHYLKLLEYSPDEPYLQAEVARNLPVGQLDALLDILRSRPEPADAAYGLAAYSTENPIVLKALETFLAEVAPDSPKLAIVRGMRLAAERQTDAASEAYLQAYRQAKASESSESDATPSASAAAGSGIGGSSAADGGSVAESAVSSLADDALSYFHELFWDADQPLEAYARSPDKAATFSYLVYQSSEYELPSETRRELADKHAAIAPNDPELLAFQAENATAEQLHEQAAELWERVLATGPDYSYAAASLAAELVELERTDDAVRLVRDHPGDVSLLEAVRPQLEQEGNFNLLLELTRLTRPEGFQGQYLVAISEAAALTGLRRFDDAENVLQKQYEAAEFAWQRGNLCRAWLALAEKAGWPEIRFLDVRGREAVSDLASACEQAGPDRLEHLLAQWKERGGDPSRTLPAAVTLLAQRQEIDKIASLVDSSAGPVALTSDPSGESLKQYIRSLLRNGKPAQAESAASMMYDLTGDAFELVLVQMALSKWDESIETAKVMSPSSRESFYYDEIALPLLRTEAATGFRRRFPRGADSLAWSAAVILLKSPLVASRDDQLAQFKADLERRQPGSVVEELHTANASQLLLKNESGGTWLVAWGSDSYFKQADASSIENTKLRTLAAAHTGWIALDWGGGRDIDSASGWSDLGHLIETLAPQEASLLILQTAHGRFLCPFSGPLVKQMQQPGFTSFEIKDREACYLFRSSDASPESRLISTWPAFAAAFADRAPGDEFRVTGTISLPHGGVPVTLDVEGVVARSYYSTEVVVDSDGLPAALRHLVPSETLQIDGWALTDWTYTKDGRTYRAADQSAVGGQEPSNDTER